MLFKRAGYTCKRGNYQKLFCLHCPEGFTLKRKNLLPRMSLFFPFGEGPFQMALGVQASKEEVTEIVSPLTDDNSRNTPKCTRPSTEKWIQPFPTKVILVLEKCLPSYRVRVFFSFIAVPISEGGLCTELSKKSKNLTCRNNGKIYQIV